MVIRSGCQDIFLTKNPPRGGFFVDETIFVYWVPCVPVPVFDVALFRASGYHGKFLRQLGEHRERSLFQLATCQRELFSERPDR